MIKLFRDILTEALSEVNKSKGQWSSSEHAFSLMDECDEILQLTQLIAIKVKKGTIRSSVKQILRIVSVFISKRFHVLLKDGDVTVFKFYDAEELRNGLVNNGVYYCIAKFDETTILNQLGKDSWDVNGDATIPSEYLLEDVFRHLFIGVLGTSDSNSPTFKRIYGWNDVKVVDVSKISPGYRGKGYGKLLYASALKDVDALISSDTLYEGSYHIWSETIPKFSGFFGILVSDKDTLRIGGSTINLVIPTTDQKSYVAAEKHVKDVEGRFITVGTRFVASRKTNKLIDNLIQAFKRVDFSRIITCYVPGATSDEMVDVLDDASDIEDVLQYVEVEFARTPNPSVVKAINNHTTLILYTDSAVFVIKETANGIDWSLM